MRHFACALLLAAVPLSLRAQPPAVWPISNPFDEGLDPAAVDRAYEYIQNECPTRQSFLVVRNGRIVAERYFRGSSTQTISVGNSMTKSVLSALFGIAIQQGRIRSIDQRVSEFFPEYGAQFRDPLRSQWRIRDLIGMTSGIAYEDFNDPGYQSGSDWVRNVLSLPVLHAPGEQFSYYSGLSHVAAVLLSKAVGRPLLDYAMDHLFRPIGITHVEWLRDPRGNYTGGWGLSMYPRDWARFGELFLRQGNWNGRQVVPEEWVAASTSVQFRNLGRTYPPLPNGLWPMASVGDYGFGWWRKPGRNYMMIAALGIRGQAIYIAPELDLVMVTLASNSGSIVRDVEVQCHTLMTNYLLPGVLARSPQVRMAASAASGLNVVSPNAFVSVYGRELTNRVATWAARDGMLPLSLAGVRVTAGGKQCAVSYANPAQVNALLPPDLPEGDTELEIENEAGSAVAAVRVERVAPAVLAVPGMVRRGEAVEVYAMGLGDTAEQYAFPEVVTAPLPLDARYTVRAFVGDHSARVAGAVLRYAGVWQVNVEVPGDMPAGESEFVLEVNGVRSHPSWKVSVKD